jgi:L-alanine-DL-glutamate epimerase-like enolase superfamily enzyme
MNIESLSVFSIPLALNEPLRTATGTHESRDAVLVRAQSEGKSGWGENVAPIGDFYVGENAASSIRVMIDQMLPKVLSCDDITPEKVSPTFGFVTSSGLSPRTSGQFVREFRQAW